VDLAQGAAVGVLRPYGRLDGRGRRGRRQWLTCGLWWIWGWGWASHVHRNAKDWVVDLAQGVAAGLLCRA
jgi:hypothetical protein